MKTFRQIASFLFLGIFLFAWSVKTVHVLLEEHKEVVCTETDHHFHESEEKCFVCEFNLQLTDEHFFNCSELSADLKLVEKTFSVYSFFLVKFSTSYDSRGPPYMA